MASSVIPDVAVNCSEVEVCLWVPCVTGTQCVVLGNLKFFLLCGGCEEMELGKALQGVLWEGRKCTNLPLLLRDSSHCPIKSVQRIKRFLFLNM